MLNTKRIACRTALAGMALVAALGMSTVSRADIVANFGTLAIGDAESVTCNKSSCVATTGATSGSIPGAIGSTFTHYVVFEVSQDANTLTSNQVLDNTQLDTDNMTVKLFEVTGTTTPGAVDPTLGTLLGTATKTVVGFSTSFLLAIANLDPTKTYALQIAVGGLGVTGTSPSYAQQVSVSPVPLPPALLLLGAALAGLVGFARVRRRPAASA